MPEQDIAYRPVPDLPLTVEIFDPPERVKTLVATLMEQVRVAHVVTAQAQLRAVLSA